MSGKKKLPFAIFIGFCLTLCMIPVVFMPFFRSDSAIGNETQTVWPSVRTEEGRVNVHLLDGMGSYFETHYAFRPWLITADAKLMSSMLVSNTATVITGSDGWLYYSSTLKDYLGEEQLSERGMRNIAHNLFLIQNYVHAMGAQFLFLSPPNKNSLYPDNMPYYYGIRTGDTFNRDRLDMVLEEAEISCLDLFSLFREQKETLYFKQDSHWNNKGAMLVYGRILSALEIDHEAYETCDAVFHAIHRGDLGNMIYPASDYQEGDYDYGLEPQYEYVPGPASSEPVSVEDFRIETSNEHADGCLLMYRDSFGNTLIPLLADRFARGYFAKSTPYPVARDMKLYEPQYVIIELAERNIRNLAKNPAIVPAPRRKTDSAKLTPAEGVKISITRCREDSDYIAFSGTVPADLADPGTKIYIEVINPDGNKAMYEAFTITMKDSGGKDNDYGFLMYLPIAQFGSAEKARDVCTGVYLD